MQIYWLTNVFREFPSSSEPNPWSLVGNLPSAGVLRSVCTIDQGYLFAEGSLLESRATVGVISSLWLSRAASEVLLFIALYADYMSAFVSLRIMRMESSKHQYLA